VLTGAKPYSAEQLKSQGLKPEQGQALATVWRQLHDEEARGRDRRRA
jgi:hypothetical protein